MIRNAILITIVIVLLLLPLALFIFRTTSISTFIRLPVKPQVSEKYIMKSDVSDYNLVLADTSFLDYMVLNMGIFNPQQIVPPDIYNGNPEKKERFTVTSIKFMLVPTIQKFLVGISGETDFAGRGDYSIDGNTLIVRVSLNMNEKGNKLAGQYTYEDTFIRTAMETLYNARGFTKGLAESEGFVKIKTDIDELLHKGLMPWPIRIEQK